MDDKKNLMWSFVIGALIIGILVGGGVSYLLLKTVKSGGTDSVSFLPEKLNSGLSDWLVKIDDYMITKSEFQADYQYFISQIPDSQKASLPSENALKKQFLDNMIGQYVIVIKALNDGTVQSKEGQLLLKTALRQAVYQIYLQKYIPQDKSSFLPSKIELDQIYKKYEDQFKKSGMNEQQRKNYMDQVITPQLSQQKLQSWVADFVNVAKESYKIKRNEDLILKEGITAAPQSPLLLPQVGK